MPNTFPTPIVLPDPNEFGSGRDLIAGSMGELLTTMNWCHAEGHAAPVVEQEWGDNLCNLAGAGTVNGVCEWPIPVLSGAHTVAEIRVEGFSTLAAGTVRFNSSVAAATINAVVPVGASAWVLVGSLAVTGGPATEEFITMDLLGGGAGATLQIDRVIIRYTRIGSPLAATKVGGFTPYGAAYYAADEPLPSYVGNTLVDGQADLLARRRSYSAWSGLNGLGGATSATLTDSSRIVTTPYSRGAADRGVQMTLWAKVAQNAAQPTYIRPGFLMGGTWVWWGGAQTIVPAGGAAAAWYSVSFTPPEVNGVRSVPHLLLRMRPWVVDENDAAVPSQVHGFAFFGV